MNTADLIIRALKDAGVTHAFGVPSGNVLPLLEAARQGGIEFVLMAHEGSAGFAADVMARLTGRPGFCISTMGPGATNLATGVGCAYLDRSAVIAVTCTIPTHQFGRRVQMAIDHHALFRPITKATCPLRGDAAATLAAALGTAMSEPPGPVHLDLPEDVAVADAGGETAAPLSRQATRLPAPPAEDLARVAELLRGARRPVAVIGASARRLRNPALLRAFVEHHHLPFASTTMAKGMIDEDHPLSIGCIERARRQIQREFLRSADLIVGLGYDVAEVEYEQWIGATPLVSVDVERVDADASVSLLHEAVGDLDEALARLLEAPAGTVGWPKGTADTHRDRFQASLRPAGWTFAPWQAIDVARRVLPRDGILAFDVGAHTHQIASQWTAHAPGQFLVTNNWSSMGFGIPAAIAAKLARPTQPVLCIVGDGCFQMTCGEVAVAQRLGLAIPIVVLDDGWLSLIEVKQTRKGLPIYGTRLRNDAPPPARSHYFGAPAVVVRTPEELEAALREALGATGPTVIEARIEGEQYKQTVYD
jgi:acetolactate synthase I/II/III large subunit